MVKRNSSIKSMFANGGSYEAKIAEIETIITRIESGELELADVFTEFATAVEYLKECDSFLQQRQQQVDLLIETLQDDEQ
ncbi:exodeoxyribonuclease VII small subunit [Dolichospermum sp. LEGE 00240]|jgi:exodeoxyribonuclease VII small subunit|uniref:exodeoxyribonuclease VII small subunit n=1 Tax=Dolichospermum sp. LEGE 00240 TaxID=1828603 RepID=UPI00188259DC|nr:exodeoxyribonuclease VII small subunit [Dolichospermum sp. LEGE 00240]MBE9250990.1 exodeoxyribonuclease VII small subunit [Dolichospermum sp. LEGE 00240]